MSMRQRNSLMGLGALFSISALMLVGVVGKPGSAQYRTIVVTAKDMMYNQTNPDIILAPGEWIRLVFRNEEPGVKHNLVIDGLGLATPILKTGEEAVLLFRAPPVGSFDYFCTLHPLMMRGALIVKAPGTQTTVANRTGISR